jgi:hypothetical protein
LPGPVRPRPRAARVGAGSEALGRTKRHQSARPTSRIGAKHSGSPSAFGAARRRIVRDALGQLGLAVGRQSAANARLATAGLARQLRANASSARVDATLARDRPGARGSVVAIDLKAGNAEAAGIVVAREQTYTDGRADLGGQRYRVYLIRLKRERNGWGVSAWEPQP